ncbi:MAG: TRAP transporter large permease [Spirochaetales bacterium]|jgi:tripartite ATP-independent transporter DctM subunit|nr:TRAP transporter large permease [Spirochaetales bacterium]
MGAGTVFFIMFFLLLAMILLRVPVSFALAFAVIPVLIMTPAVGPVMLLQRMMIQFGSFILLSIPFFILAANIMNEAGITDQLMRFSRSIVGFLPGGLGHVNVFVSMIFAGISGSSNADAAGIGSVIIPAMIKEGYGVNFSVAVTACSAVMGVIIPPSILMVVWGGTLNVSVGGLFLAGIIPGILIGILQMAVVLVYAIKYKYPREARFSIMEVWRSLKSSILALMSPLIIIGGIVGGFVTPTEASLIAVVYSMAISMLIFKTVTIKSFLKLLLDTVRLSSVVLFAVGTAAIYAWVMSFYKIPSFLVGAVSTWTTSPHVMLIIIVIIFLIVGMFIDGTPAIIIFAPLLRPLADAVGVNPLHFAVVGCVAISYGLITPPYGLCLLITSKIAKINCIEPMREVCAFLGVMLFVLILMIFVPDVTLWVPKLLMPELFPGAG